jgi:hypothetical protein
MGSSIGNAAGALLSPAASLIRPVGKVTNRILTAAGLVPETPASPEQTPPPSIGDPPGPVDPVQKRKKAMAGRAGTFLTDGYANGTSQALGQPPGRSTMLGL